MRRTLMTAKIHRATITDANLNYEGGITLDRDLMDAADLLEFERVHVLDIDNGARFETYVIEGARGGGDVCVNGAAARLVHPGDKVIVISYGEFEPDEATAHSPLIVPVDERNRPLAELRRA